MARGMLIAEQSIATNGVASVTPWTEARDRFAEANRYWLATVRPDGRPHIMPVFGIWLGDALYFTAARTSRKAKNLALNVRCVVAADVPTLDVVVEGEAVRVSDEAKLHLVADAYASKYEWPLTVRDGTFFAEYGAPSAGSPPYDLYEMTPVTGFGLGMDEPFGATRWKFWRGGREAAHGEHTCSDRSNSHTSPHRSDGSRMDGCWLAWRRGKAVAMTVVRVRGFALPEGEPVDLYADGDRWTTEPMARIVARAGASEVFVSGITRDLTEGATGLTFESRGRHRLKGLDREHDLFAAGLSAG